MITSWQLAPKWTEAQGNSASSLGAIITQQSIFRLGLDPWSSEEGDYQSKRMRPGSNGRHFHNNDSCILSASRLITPRARYLPLKKCSFVKIDALSELTHSLPRRP